MASNTAVPTSETLPPGEDERRLVARMRAGDERAFATFADAFLPGLYRFARRRLGGDPELTREIVQATACKVVAGLEGYRGDAPLFTWLCACCRNEIAAHFRRLGRRPREVAFDELPPEEVLGAAPSDDDGPQARALREEESELVHAALDGLPESYSRALEWRYLDGLTVPEIAGRLDATYKATESLLSRARSAFRELYQHRAGEPSAGVAASPREEAVQR